MVDQVVAEEEEQVALELRERNWKRYANLKVSRLSIGGVV